MRFNSLEERIQYAYSNAYESTAKRMDELKRRFYSGHDLTKSDWIMLNDLAPDYAADNDRILSE